MSPGLSGISSLFFNLYGYNTLFISWWMNTNLMTTRFSQIPLEKLWFWRWLCNPRGFVAPPFLNGAVPTTDGTFRTFSKSITHMFPRRPRVTAYLMLSLSKVFFCQLYMLLALRECDVERRGNIVRFKEKRKIDGFTIVGFCNKSLKGYFI